MRYDILIQGGAPSTFALKSLAHDQQGDQFPGVQLAMVSVGEGAGEAAAIPAAVGAIDDVSTLPIDHARVITFAEDQATGHFLIDGKMLDENRVNQTVKLGALEVWTIVNDNNQQHPFHIHTNDFQVESMNDEFFAAASHEDTVNLPVLGRVVIRIPFKDVAGKSVYHCHFLNHADMGMMAIVEVVARAPSRPAPAWPGAPQTARPVNVLQPAPSTWPD